jgi:hypothetical protein
MVLQPSFFHAEYQSPECPSACMFSAASNGGGSRSPLPLSIITDAQVHHRSGHDDDQWWMALSQLYEGRVTIDKFEMWWRIWKLRRSCTVSRGSGSRTLRRDCDYNREGVYNWEGVGLMCEELIHSVPLRNGANEPLVVKNVCAILTGGEPKLKHARHVRNFLTFFKFRFHFVFHLTLSRYLDFDSFPSCGMGPYQSVFSVILHSSNDWLWVRTVYSAEWRIEGNFHLRICHEMTYDRHTCPTSSRAVNNLTDWFLTGAHHSASFSLLTGQNDPESASNPT